MELKGVGVGLDVRRQSPLEARTGQEPGSRIQLCPSPSEGADIQGIKRSPRRGLTSGIFL